MYSLQPLVTYTAAYRSHSLNDQDIADVQGYSFSAFVLPMVRFRHDYDLIPTLQIVDFQLLVSVELAHIRILPHFESQYSSPIRRIEFYQSLVEIIDFDFLVWIVEEDLDGARLLSFIPVRCTPLQFEWLSDASDLERCCRHCFVYFSMVSHA
jgi:hypothetical protein